MPADLEEEHYVVVIACGKDGVPMRQLLCVGDGEGLAPAAFVTAGDPDIDVGGAFFSSANHAASTEPSPSGSTVEAWQFGVGSGSQMNSLIYFILTSQFVFGRVGLGELQRLLRHALERVVGVGAAFAVGLDYAFFDAKHRSSVGRKLPWRQ